MTWKSGDISLHNGAAIHNLSSATFVDQLTGKRDIRHDNSGQLERFINEGTFIKSGPPFTGVNVAFDNSGTVEVQRGTLGLFGGGSNSGTIDIGEGATMAIRGSYLNDISGIIQGTGTFNISNAIFTNEGTIAPTVIIVD
ncbi:hypothetical protein GC175_17485 [bacterium]|nr:hypothetical protein [bacterium]